VALTEEVSRLQGVLASLLASGNAAAVRSALLAENVRWLRSSPSGDEAADVAVALSIVEALGSDLCAVGDDPAALDAALTALADVAAASQSSEVLLAVAEAACRVPPLPLPQQGATLHQRLLARFLTTLSSLINVVPRLSWAAVGDGKPIALLPQPVPGPLLPSGARSDVLAVAVPDIADAMDAILVVGIVTADGTSLIDIVVGPNACSMRPLLPASVFDKCDSLEPGTPLNLNASAVIIQGVLMLLLQVRGETFLTATRVAAMGEPLVMGVMPRATSASKTEVNNKSKRDNDNENEENDENEDDEDEDSSEDEEEGDNDDDSEDEDDDNNERNEDNSNHEEKNQRKVKVIESTVAAMTMQNLHYNLAARRPVIVRTEPIHCDSVLTRYALCLGRSRPRGCECEWRVHNVRASRLGPGNSSIQRHHQGLPR
jgi:hypothetical protein